MTKGKANEKLAIPYKMNYFCIKETYEREKDKQTQSHNDAHPTGATLTCSMPCQRRRDENH